MPEYRTVRIPHKAHVTEPIPEFSSVHRIRRHGGRCEVEGFPPLQLPKDCVLLRRRQLESGRRVQLRTLGSVELQLQLQVETVFSEPEGLDRRRRHSDLAHIVDAFPR